MSIAKDIDGGVAPPGQRGREPAPISSDCITSPIDMDRAWRLHPQVALRPERFGALAYHFGTRRLSFLKTRMLLDVVTALDGVRSAREACTQAGVSAAEFAQYGRALTTLATSEMIVCAGAS